MFVTQDTCGIHDKFLVPKVTFVFLGDNTFRPFINLVCSSYPNFSSIRYPPQTWSKRRLRYMIYSSDIFTGYIFSELFLALNYFLHFDEPNSAKIYFFRFITLSFVPIHLHQNKTKTDTKPCLLITCKLRIWQHT